MTTTKERKDYEPNIVLATQKYEVVGTRPIRHDGADKVTGRAKYGADFQAVGQLHGKILRSPHAHARIKNIDTRKAEALAGVKAVVTGRDLPDAGGDLALKYKRNNILAGDKVLYKGHAVAGIAATSPHTAEEALELIEVDYEVLPPVLDVLESMGEDAPLLHEHLTTEELGVRTEKVSNVARHVQHRMGDVEGGFEEADEVAEGEFYAKTVHQGYIEPHPCAALWNEDGRLMIWCSTQGPFLVRDYTSEVLGIGVSEIRVTPMEIGGGFGGKTEIYLEPVAALLSKKTGHPVKMVMSRKEVFESTGPTCGSYVKVKIGATKDGKLMAGKAYYAFEAGAFPGSPVVDAAVTLFSVYDVPNVLIDGYDVVVNKPKTAAYRAPGGPNVSFASEQIIDELAIKLGIDPIDLRLLNVAREGTRRSDGMAHHRIGCLEGLEAMKNHPHYKTPLEGPNRGRGVAASLWFHSGLESACTISVTENGKLNLLEGSADIGGTRAAVAMQAAEVLGLKAGDVNPVVVDTDSIGYTACSDGSRTAFATGWAAYEAAWDVKRQMIERAARIWETGPGEVEMEGGELRSRVDPGQRMSFKELAEQLKETGGAIVGRGSVNPHGVGGSFAGVIADVEVDPETGKVEIRRFTSIQDAGKAIHPSYVEGQMQGGSVQGIGWALNEEYYMSEDGTMLNSSFLDYRMPTVLDLPMIDTVIVEVANPGHPYGARGVGEASIIPPLPAVANAIYDAVGVRMNKLPMNPGAIMEAIWREQKEKGDSPQKIKAGE